MEYNRIIAITGLSGLFELLSSKADGAIVRSLEDNQTKFVSSRVHNFSHLESIEVYTVRENINLVDLFKAIQTSGVALPSDKDAGAVKAFFTKVYPDMDFDRIYNSDMKKMIKWYALLSSHNIEFALPAATEEEADEAELGSDEDHSVATAPAPKTKAKASSAPAEAPAPAKAAAVKAEAPAKEEAAEKPKKKAAKPEVEEAPAAPKKKATPAPKAAAAEDKKPAKKKKTGE